MPGEPKEAVPVQSLVGTTEDRGISETEDNGQPHSEMEFLWIFKKPVPKEVTVNESQVHRPLPDSKFF